MTSINSKKNKDSDNEQRSKEFLQCMGNGVPIHQLEEENDYIDSQILKITEDKK
jgi:hypothetical protein